MARKSNASDKVKTPKFRVSYPNVFTPKLNELSGKEEYSLVCVFPKEADLTELIKAVKQAATNMWGADPKKWPKKLRSPFRDQEERKDEETGKLPEGYVEGAKFITIKSYKKPGVVDGRQKNKAITETEQHEFYAGCFARAEVVASPYDVKGNAGVSFWFNYLQKMADGDPLSGRRKAEDVFEAIEGASEGESADSVFGSEDSVI